MAPITLSTGDVVPKGMYICMNAGSMAMDASFYSSPTMFSPERFYSAANATLENDKSPRITNFVATESGNIHWGSGRFTCPGRWYASAMMKVIMALIVTQYDITFPEGQTKRLPNVYMDILVEPNPRQSVLFRQR
jgi:cytochrome P450